MSSRRFTIRLGSFLGSGGRSTAISRSTTAQRAQSKRSLLALDTCVFLALFFTGAILRLHWLPATQLDENTVFPYTKALYLLSNWSFDPLPDFSRFDASWFMPPVFHRDAHFGPGLTWAHLTFLAAADSMGQSVARRLILQSTAAPVLYLALRMGLQRLESKPHLSPFASLEAAWPSVIAALVAALAVGFTQMPYGILGPTDDTYIAPELSTWYAAAAVVALLARRPRFLLLAFPTLAFTMMVHPFTVCYALGCIVIVITAWFRRQRVHLAAGLALAAVVAVPEVVQVFGIVTSGEAMSETTGLCDPERRTFAWLLSTSASTIDQLEPRSLGLLLLLGLPVTCAALGIMTVFDLRRASTLLKWRQPRSLHRGVLLCTIWCVANLVGLLFAGTLVGCLQPWHWSLVLPSMSIQLGLAVYLLVRGLRGSKAWGVVALSRAALVLLTAAVIWQAADIARTHWAKEPYGYAHLETCRDLAHTIQADVGADDRWIEAITLDHSDRGYPWVYPPALFIEQRLTPGVPPESFNLDGLLYLIVDGPPEDIQSLGGAMGWDVGTPDSPVSAGSGDRTPNDPQPAIGYENIHLLAVSKPTPSVHLLLVRIVKARESAQWTGDLCDLFPDQRVRTHLDTLDYLSLTPAAWTWKEFDVWFDPCIRM